MIPWFIWVTMICTPIAIISRILLDRIKNKQSREIENHLKNQDEKTLPKGFPKQHYTRNDNQ